MQSSSCGSPGTPRTPRRRSGGCATSPSRQATPWPLRAPASRSGPRPRAPPPTPTSPATGRGDLAVALFERVLEQIENDAPEDVAAEVRFTTYLSYALTDLNDLDRAQSVLDAVLEKADEMTDAYSRFRLYWSLARLNEIQGRPAAALDHVRRAIALLAVTEDTLHLAR